MVAAGKLSGRDRIGLRVGKVVGKYKMAKHFDLDIQDAAFSFSVNGERLATGFKPCASGARANGSIDSRQAAGADDCRRR